MRKRREKKGNKNGWENARFSSARFWITDMDSEWICVNIIDAEKAGGESPYLT